MSQKWTLNWKICFIWSRKNGKGGKTRKNKGQRESALAFDREFQTRAKRTRGGKSKGHEMNIVLTLGKCGKGRSKESPLVRRLESKNASSLSSLNLCLTSRSNSSSGMPRSRSANLGESRKWNDIVDDTVRLFVNFSTTQKVIHFLSQLLRQTTFLYEGLRVTERNAALRRCAAPTNEWRRKKRACASRLLAGSHSKKYSPSDIAFNWPIKTREKLLNVYMEKSSLFYYSFLLN